MTACWSHRSPVDGTEVRRYLETRHPANANRSWCQGLTSFLCGRLTLSTQSSPSCITNCSYACQTLKNLLILSPVLVYLQQQQQRPFNGLWSGTTRVSRYQKKHSPTHTHPVVQLKIIYFALRKHTHIIITSMGRAYSCVCALNGKQPELSKPWSITEKKSTAGSRQALTGVKKSVRIREVKSIDLHVNKTACFF